MKRTETPMLNVSTEKSANVVCVKSQKNRLDGKALNVKLFFFDVSIQLFFIIVFGTKYQKVLEFSINMLLLLFFSSSLKQVVFSNQIKSERIRREEQRERESSGICQSRFFTIFQEGI